MKILHIVPSYKPAYVYGGPIESVAHLCEGLKNAGHTIKVFTTTANGKTELDVVPGKEIAINGVPVIYFKRITKDHTHISPSLWKALNRECIKYDIVHIHSWWNILVVVAAIICHRKKARVVISPRGMFNEYILHGTNSKIKKAIQFLGGRTALTKSYFHATSENEYKECKKLIPAWKGFVLPNFIELPQIKITKHPNPVFTIIFLARIHAVKGLELLLEAIGKIDLPVLLKIAGTGDMNYISELKLKVSKLGIQKKVKWLGWKNRDEKFYELMQADLLVLTSYTENFANVVIESLHVGIPVLVSENVGLASFVKEQNLGWVVKLNAESIKSAIEESINQTEKRCRIMREASNKIHSFFSEEILIKDYISNYEKIIFSKQF